MSNKKLTEKEKIKKLNGLFSEFHANMLVLMRKQTELLRKVNELIDKKKLQKTRNEIEKM